MAYDMEAADAVEAENSRWRRLYVRSSVRVLRPYLTELAC